MSVAHQSGRCTSGEVSIFYRRLGQPGGIPLVLLHGLSYFSWDWLEVAQALGGEREVVAMDMRGFGDSGWSKSRDYSVVTMAKDVRALLDHLGWQRAIVSGHSMGGRSAACFAATEPARAAGLVLIDYSPENLPEGTQRTARTVAGVPDVFPSIEAAMAYFKQEKRERFEAYLTSVEGGYTVKRDPHFRNQFRKLLATGERAKLDVDMWQVMRELRCPILSLRGLRSDMYGAPAAEKMKAANARLQLAEIDAGHDIAGQNRDGFLAAVQPFLARIDGGIHEKAA
jgi:esterase